jgi:hypothetical protein
MGGSAQSATAPRRPGRSRGGSGCWLGAARTPGRDKLLGTVSEAYLADHESTNGHGPVVWSCPFVIQKDEPQGDDNGAYSSGRNVLAAPRRQVGYCNTCLLDVFGVDAKTYIFVMC